MPDYQSLLQVWSRLEEFNRLKECTAQGEGPGAVFGMPEESAVTLCAALLQEESALVIVQDESGAQRMAEELDALLGSAVYLPARDLQLRAFAASSRELAATRVAALSALVSGRKTICVASVECAMQRVAPPEVFRRAAVELEDGGSTSLSSLPARLRGAGYERVEKVDAPGQFRLAGGILDVYPFDRENPIRAEFFDDEVDSLRVYDPESQRSMEKLQRAAIPPATEVPLTGEALERAGRALAPLRRRGVCLRPARKLGEGGCRGGGGISAPALRARFPGGVSARGSQNGVL